jgi:hypothetical protein
MRYLILLLFCVQVMADISAVTLPRDISASTTPARAWVDDNDEELRDKINEIKDTVNIYGDSLAAHTTNVTALEDSLAYSNNSGTDSLVRQTSPRITTPTVTGKSTFNDTLDVNQIAVLDSLVVNGETRLESPSEVINANGNGQFIVGRASSGFVDIFGEGSDFKFRHSTDKSSWSNVWKTDGSNMFVENGDLIVGDAATGTGKILSHDNDWQLELENPNTGGVSWYLGSSDDGWSGGGGDFLLSNSTSAATAEFRINASGNLSVSGNITGDSLSTGNETFTYDEGSFADSVYNGGCSDTATGTIEYTRVGRAVTLAVVGTQSCNVTSVASTNYIYGIPASLQPENPKEVPCSFEDDQVVESGSCYVYENGSGFNLIAMRRDDGANFSNTGANGFQVKASVIHYTLD